MSDNVHKRITPILNLFQRHLIIHHVNLATVLKNIILKNFIIDAYNKFNFYYILKKGITV